jgi:sugar (pentulose or hexulose) kinase
MLAGLDIGTSSVKFSIYHTNGNVVGQKEMVYPQGVKNHLISVEEIWL